MSPPDFMQWLCANCGAVADGTQKPCDCPTGVGYRLGPNGALENVVFDEPVPVPIETGWLIELIENRPDPAYWGTTPDDPDTDGLGWTRNHLAAIRYARQADAEAIINYYGWTLGVTVAAVEHQWQ